MRRPMAAAGSALFFLLAPGIVAGAVPWWITGWRAAAPGEPVALRALGGLLVVAGASVLLSAFGRFAGEGGGTPAPVAPTERLVIGGLYRHVRNPMYLAVASVVWGQALLLGSVPLAAYGAAVLAATFAFARLYEEPVLARRYGAAYDAYRRAVPGWWPRRRAWPGPEPAPGPERP